MDGSSKEPLLEEAPPVRSTHHPARGAEHPVPSPAPHRRLKRVLPCVPPRATRPPTACPASPTSSSAS